MSKELEQPEKRPAWASNLGHVVSWLDKVGEEFPVTQTETELEGIYHLGVDQISRSRWRWEPQPGKWIIRRMSNMEYGQVWCGVHTDFKRLIARSVIGDTKYQTPMASVYGMIREENVAKGIEESEEGREHKPGSFWTTKYKTAKGKEWIYGSHTKQEYYLWKWPNTFLLMEEEAYTRFCDWFRGYVGGLRPLRCKETGETPLTWLRSDDKPINIPMMGASTSVSIRQLKGRRDEKRNPIVHTKLALRIHYPVPHETMVYKDGSPVWEKDAVSEFGARDWGICDIMEVIATAVKGAMVPWYQLVSGEVTMRQDGKVMDIYVSLYPVQPL
jgi:hypothetical protein